MPVLPTRRQQPAPVNPQVPIPNEFPAIPQEILDRFPSAKDWQTKLNEFWSRTNQALQEAQRQTAAQVNSQVIWTVDRFLIYTNTGGTMPMFALDDTGVRLGNVLVINTPGRKVYIGRGEYQDAQTPFYIDTLGRFSLGANLTWDPDTSTLNVTGTITATSGSIGGFDIGTDYIRDTANSFGLASTVTMGQDVRIWSGSTFAARASAPLKIYKNGRIVVGGGSFSENVYFAITGETVVATGSSATAAFFGGTMEAGANGDALHGIITNFTFAKGVYTGLGAYGIRMIAHSSTGAGTIANAYGIYIDTVNIGTNNYAIYTTATAGSSVFLGGINSTPIGATTPSTGAFTTLSASGVTSLAAGAVGAPGLYLSTDTTSGLYRIGANNIGVAISGAKVLDIASTGLSVTGDGTFTGSQPTLSLVATGGSNSANLVFTPTTGYDANISTSVASKIIFQYNNTEVMRLGSGAVSVTGTLSASGLNNKLGDTSGVGYWGFGQSATNLNNWLLGSDGGGVFRLYNGTYGNTVNTILTASSTGLSVTGVVDINGTAASATAGHLQLGSSTQTTIGANGAASALTANPLGYLSAYLGTTHIIIPYYNA